MTGSPAGGRKSVFVVASFVRPRFKILVRTCTSETGCCSLLSTKAETQGISRVQSLSKGISVEHF